MVFEGTVARHGVARRGAAAVYITFKYTLPSVTLSLFVLLCIFSHVCALARENFHEFRNYRSLLSISVFVLSLHITVLSSKRSKSTREYKNYNFFPRSHILCRKNTMYVYVPSSYPIVSARNAADERRRAADRSTVRGPRTLLDRPETLAAWRSRSFSAIHCTCTALSASSVTQNLVVLHARIRR